MCIRTARVRVQCRAQTMCVCVLPLQKRSPETRWRSDSRPPCRPARAQHATRTRRPASAREHATPDPAPCTARPQRRAQHAPVLQNTQHATKHSTKQHNAHCTRPCRSNQPARHRRTPGAAAACAKSRVCGGAGGPQHPKCPGTNANRPLSSSQRMPDPASHQQPLASTHPARPALPPEREARPRTLQGARTPRTDGAAGPDPKRQLPLAEVHVAFTPHSDFWDGVNSRDACMHGHDSSYLTRSGWHRPSPDARKSSNELSSISHRVAIE